jgi:hypothetical protein
MAFVWDAGNVAAWWHEGSFASAAESLTRHFTLHGAEVGATTEEEYVRKAVEFSRNLRGVPKRPVDGFTEGVTRSIKNGRYIDIAPDGRIISFGGAK